MLKPRFMWKFGRDNNWQITIVKISGKFAKIICENQGNTVAFNARFCHSTEIITCNYSIA